MNKVHEELMQIGTRILSLSRSELYLSMRFLDLALSALSFDMDLRTRVVATDGVHLFYNPSFLAAAYQDDPVGVNRTYLHLILHGIFRHVIGCGEREKEDWDLACDIAVESIIDSMEYPCVRRLVRDTRQEYYDSLGLTVFNAEQVYQKLLDIPYVVKQKMKEEFFSDDHQFWNAPQDQDGEKGQSGDSSEGKEPPPNRDDVEQKWQDISQKTQTSMETFHQQSNLLAGDLLKQLHIENRTRVNYQQFLQKFAVMREEVCTDPDSFDYGFYTYGLQLYDNIPLIEELEYRETKKIHDFVIAVDTSGSCTGKLLQRFLEQTASILLDQNSFFRSVNVHVIQCDADIQSDIKITDIEQFQEMMQSFETKGDGDTDFRPVFDYVDQLIRQGEMTHLQGILFFTDGVGIFPKKRPAYDTAFIFFDDNYTDRFVPPWAIKLVLGRDDLNL